jgi:hypothetical protein
MLQGLENKVQFGLLHNEKLHCIYSPHTSVKGNGGVTRMGHKRNAYRMQECRILEKKLSESILLKG